jgi:hypothetical protein
MTDEPAAIKATFSDFRLIKGRKQAQLVLEIPIEEADNALAALGGIPQPQSDHWVAVARLNGVAKPEPELKEKRRWEDLKLSMQASIRCNEPAFHEFLLLKWPGFQEIDTSDQAASALRIMLNVGSRSGLNTDPVAAEQWKDLDRSYQAWLKVAE